MCSEWSRSSLWCNWGGGQLGNSTLKRDNLGMALEFIALSTDCQCQLVLCGFVQYIQDISFSQLTDLII